MELELERPQRIVEYFGLRLFVPHDTAFLSTDSEGRVVAHSDCPWTEPNFWEGDEIGEVAKVVMPPGLDWSKTLREYIPEEI